MTNRPRSWEVALHLAVWMVFFKWFGPLKMHHGVYDPIDDWCIAGGGFVAWLIWQRQWLTGILAARHESRATRKNPNSIVIIGRLPVRGGPLNDTSHLTMTFLDCAHHGLHRGAGISASPRCKSGCCGAASPGPRWLGVAVCASGPACDEQLWFCCRLSSRRAGSSCATGSIFPWRSRWSGTSLLLQLILPGLILVVLVLRRVHPVTRTKPIRWPTGISRRRKFPLSRRLQRGAGGRHRHGRAWQR